MRRVLRRVLSRVRLSVTPWTVARQAPLSMGFSRQEHWSALPGPPPADLPDPGIELVSPALAGSLYHCTTWDYVSILQTFSSGGCISMIMKTMYYINKHCSALSKCINAASLLVAKLHLPLRGHLFLPSP